MRENIGIFCLAILRTGLVVCIFSLQACNKGEAKQQEIYVVFRYDDYSPLSPTEIEIKIIEEFRRNRGSITFGVIPFLAVDCFDPAGSKTIPLSAMKRNILRDGIRDGTLEVAMHGYSHRTNRREKMTEFSGLSYDTQVKRLREGKIFLEKIIERRVNLFIPPWNAYDENTVHALETTGFSIISADLGGMAVTGSTIKCVPASCFLPEAKDAVERSRQSSEKRPMIVVLFHGYDFLDINERQGTMSYRDFSKLLTWLGAQKDVRLVSIGEVSKIVNPLDWERFLLNSRMKSKSQLLFSGMQVDRGVYGKDCLLMEVWARVLVVHLIIFLCSLILGKFFFSRYGLLRRFVKSGGNVAMVIGIITVAVYDKNLGWKAMVTIDIAMGMCLGTWLGLFYLKRNS